MRIDIIRHGETDYNRRLLVQGKTDIPLNETGRSQAAEARKKLGEPVYDRVYVSPLKRAVETAELISGVCKADMVVDLRLEEMGFGVMEGTKLEELPSHVNALFYEPEKFYPPEGGESIEELAARCSSFLDDLKKEHQTFPADGRVLIVSHSAAIHGLIACIAASPIEDFWRARVMNCTAIQVACDGERFILETDVWNV